MLLLSPAELVAQKQAQDVNRLVGGGAAMLPARDVQFSRAASSQESTWQRLGVLEDAAAGRLNVLCVSAEGALDRCCPAERFRAAGTEVREGGTLSPTTLIDRLVRFGYERVPMVEGKGQCAMRGDILDVFPPHETDALRIEFFGDEVDTVRRFDCISQRSIERVKRVWLGSATECLPEDAQAAADRLSAALTAAPAPGESAPVSGPPSDAPADGLMPLNAFLTEIDEMDEEASASARELAATALIDAAAKSAPGAPAPEAAVSEGTRRRSATWTTCGACARGTPSAPRPCG